MPPSPLFALIVRTFCPEGVPPLPESQRTTSRSAFTMLTYGGGTRNCMGMPFARLELGMALALMLRGYEWRLLPGQDLSFSCVPSLHPKDGAQVEMRSRGVI